MNAISLDAAEINRTILKEPTYRSEPSYFLLMFGQSARKQMWVVIDREDFYVDRNCDGDLTDEACHGTVPGYFELGRIGDRGRACLPGLHARPIRSVGGRNSAPRLGKFHGSLGVLATSARIEECVIVMARTDTHAHDIESRSEMRFGRQAATSQFGRIRLRKKCLLLVRPHRVIPWP
jgi:hypothetical protein